MASNQRNITMDFIRGFSAILVCCGHLRAVIFIDYLKLKSPSLLDRFFYFFTSLGHEAVMVFFVLSGFFVGGSVLSKKLKFKSDSYLIARLSRLWTVLVPALVFTFLLDLIIRHYFPAILEGNYHFELMSGPGVAFSDSFLTFISNIAFLQSIYSPVYGTNGPLWSLTYEFWYYITFPLMMIAVGVVRKSRNHRMISLVLLAIVGYCFTRYVFGGFLIWLCGVVVYLIYSRKLMNLGVWFTVVSFGLLIFSLINSKIDFLYPSVFVPSDYIVGICFSLFLISLRNIEKSSWVKKYLAKLSFWLSDISYTLYVIHFPIFLLVYGMFYSDRQVELNLLTILEYFGWLLLVVIISRGFWWVFERNTAYTRTYMFKLRNRVMGELKSKST